ATGSAIHDRTTGRGRFFISGEPPPGERLRPTRFTTATIRPDPRTTDVEPSARPGGFRRPAGGGDHHQPLPALLLVAGLGRRVFHGRAVVLAGPADGVRAPGHRGRTGGAGRGGRRPARRPHHPGGPVPPGRVRFGRVAAAPDADGAE